MVPSVISVSLVLLLLRGMILGGQAKVFDLEIISLIPNNNSTGTALRWSGGPLQLAIENVGRQYAPSLRVSLKLLYNVDDRTCEDSDDRAPLLLSDYYNRTQAWDRCVVVVAVGCGGLSVVPFLAKEWNTLLFSSPSASSGPTVRVSAWLVAIVYSAIMSTTVFNPTDAPTSIGLPGSFEGIASALLELFRTFKWWHVTLLEDSTATTDFYRQVVRIVKALDDLPEHAGFRIDAYRFDSTKDKSTEDALMLARRRSRVLLVLAHTSVVIKVLRSLGGTKNVNLAEYAFVTFQPSQQSVYGSVSLFDTTNELDAKLFGSVIFLTTYGVTGNKSSYLNKLLIDQEKRTYGSVSNYGPTLKPLDLYSNREAYNSVQLAAFLVNNSLHLQHRGSTVELSPQEVCGGWQLRSLLLNRTFHFPSGRVNFNADGSRHADLFLYTFDGERRTMQITARYESSSESYLWVPNVTFVWLTDGTAPLDVPVCGFSGLDKPCRTQTVFIERVLLPFLLAGLVPAILAVGYQTRKKVLLEGQDVWWYLQQEKLDMTNARIDARHIYKTETSVTTQQSYGEKMR